MNNTMITGHNAVILIMTGTKEPKPITGKIYSFDRDFCTKRSDQKFKIMENFLPCLFKWLTLVPDWFRPVFYYYYTYCCIIGKKNDKFWSQNVLFL